MNTVILAGDLGIGSASALHQQLLTCLHHNDPVVLDAHQVSRIHTAAIQVLCAFVQARQAAGRSTSITHASDVLKEAAQLLDVSALLGLDGAPSASV